MSATPTAHELQAAVVAGRLIDGGGSTRTSLSASYASAVTGGIFRTHDLERGQQLLERAGLVAVEEDWCTPSAECLQVCELADDVAAELLLQIILTTDPPLWLYAAISADEVRWENVPEQDQAALRQSITEADRREALLLGLGQKFDADAQAALGAEGEEHVVAACRRYLTEVGREDLAREVRRVSLVSDALGYDVTSPDTTGQRHRLEVKTTTGVGDSERTLNFYVSRNEAKVGQGDPTWALVAVRKDSVTGVISIVGWCRADTFADALPNDPESWGRWASARIYLDEEKLKPGLPLDG